MRVGKLKKIMLLGVLLLFFLSLNVINAVDPSDSGDNSTFSQTSTNGSNVIITKNMTNSEIQNVFFSSPENSTIIFSRGQYNNLEIYTFKPFKIRANGTVVIKGSGSSTAFTLLSNCDIQGVTIRNYDTAISNMANNFVIVNNTFLYNKDAVSNSASGSGVKISTTNVFQSNNGSAIYNYGNNLIFKGFKMTGNKVGITNSGSNVTLSYNTMTGGQYGIINYAAFAIINFNKISSTTQYGIQNFGNKTIMGNNTLQNNNGGIYNQGTGSTITLNKISGGKVGVLTSANSTTVAGNTVKSVKTYGIYHSGSKNKVYNNNLTGINKGYGIYADKKAKSDLVQGNTVTKFSYGIWEDGSSDTLKSNTLVQNGIGISVSSSARNTQATSNKISKSTTCGIYNQGISSIIYKNGVTSGKYGIFNGAKSADINSNKISSTSQRGIQNTGSNSKIRSNTLQNKNYGIYNSGSGVTISSNKITGGNVGVLTSANSATVTGNTVKSVKTYGIYNSGSKNKIYNNNLTGLNKGYGVYIDKKVKSNLIQGNKITKFSYGLLDAGSSDNIKSNIITYCKVGLYLSAYARNAQVTSNKINKSSNYGVCNEGVNSTLSKNEITSNKYGLVTVNSVKGTKNIIKGNSVNIKIIS